jgi:hypothetical protein
VLKSQVPVSQEQLLQDYMRIARQRRNKRKKQFVLGKSVGEAGLEPDPQVVILILELTQS